MKGRTQFKRIMGLILAAVMLLGTVLPAGAISAAPKGISVEKVPNSAISASLKVPQAAPKGNGAEAPLTGNVRVSIILEGRSTIEAGFTTENIAGNAAAMAYRNRLRTQQSNLAALISARVLGGKKLDTVWNLTLAANIISANVPAEKLDAIRAVPGVKKVVVETQHSPHLFTKDAQDPNMGTSSTMIGSTVAYTLGYTGAGSRIAIIDTGTDTDHQSFDAGAFEYALEENAEKAGMAKDAYLASLNLLDKTEIAGVVTELNIYNAADGDDAVDADHLYVNSKLAFGYNYVDKSYYITHDEDTASEHGSHVAGIAAANRYIPSGRSYVNALESVHVQGVAPDAQLITMKVFGKGGGAYDSDYMAAIEDAIVLGCDVANLSLGSDNGGSLSDDYQHIMDMLADSAKNPKTVVSVSAGNSSYWAAEANLPYLYNDQVNFQMVGNPGSFTNSLTVASVENKGFTGPALIFQNGDKKPLMVTFSESDGYSNAPIFSLDWSTDGKGMTYSYIFTTGYGSDEEVAALLKADPTLVRNKIVLCSRGNLINFSTKANNFAAAGARAVIIYNNEPGIIGMNLADYIYSAPVASITQEDAAGILAISTPSSKTNPLYYTGEVVINKEALKIVTGDEMEEPEEADPADPAPVGPTAPALKGVNYTMSDFSSWGVPGSLELKPEITAPGGNIYSVNGQIAGGQAYENMSGTSMAAPQITGMSAVLAQALRGKSVAGMSQRQLIQSLLMSTADPIIEADSEYYYSLLNQGAGLANVGAAVAAKSYILMDANATKSAADGKVKAELGDDPAKTGVYTFNFTVNSLSDQAVTYDLSAEIFTQDTFGAMGFDFLDTWTIPLENAEVTFKVAGAAATSVTVPADGKVNVEVTIDITDCDLSDYPVGAYIEGYLFVSEQDSQDGAVGTTHSIPVLGFYGNWTAASMYDVGSYVDYRYGLEDRYPYMTDYAGMLNLESNYLEVYSKALDDVFVVGGNPLDVDDEEDYDPVRNALNSADTLESYYFSLIRNAGGGLLKVENAETGDVYYTAENNDFMRSAYYEARYAAWSGSSSSWDFDDYDALVDDEGEPLADGTKVKVTLITAPEYYGVYGGLVDEEGQPVLTLSGAQKMGYTFDWAALTDGNAANGELGAGAYLTTTFTVDNTAPQIKTVTKTDTGIAVVAQDNQYLAKIAVYNEDGTREVTSVLPDQAAPGVYTCTLDMSECYGTRFYVAVYDYALNRSTYAVTVDTPFNGEDLTGSALVLDDYGTWYTLDKGGLTEVVETAADITAAVFADGYVFTADADGFLCVTDVNNLDTSKVIQNVGGPISDLAYDAKTGTLYAMVEGEIYTIDKLTGDTDYVGEVGVYEYMIEGLGGSNPAADTLTLDDKGNFYATVHVLDDRGVPFQHLFTFTLDTMDEPTDLGAIDLNSNGYSCLTWNPADGLLYTAQIFEGFDEAMMCDLNGDGFIDWKDAQKILDYLTGECSGEAASIFSYPGRGDFDGDGKVTSHDAHTVLKGVQWEEDDDATGVYNLITLDPKTADYSVVSELDGGVSAILFTAECDEPAWAGAADVEGVSVYPDSISLIVGDVESLTAFVTPWTASNQAVTWTSSDSETVSVDENGVITALKSGTAVITATSVADTDISGSCTVTSKNVEYTLSGVVMDEDGKSRTYTFNLETANTWTPAALDLDGSLVAATTVSYSKKPSWPPFFPGDFDFVAANPGEKVNEDGLPGDDFNPGDIFIPGLGDEDEEEAPKVMYALMDVGGSSTVDTQMVKVDTENWTALATYPVGDMSLNDMAYARYLSNKAGKDYMVGVSGTYFVMPFQPDKLEDASGLNFAAMFADTGSKYFVSVASGGYERYWDMITDGTYDTEVFYALDNNGYMWRIYMADAEAGDEMFMEVTNVVATPGLKFKSNVGPHSLTVSDDGKNMFFSYLNDTKSTSEIYMITPYDSGKGYTLYKTKRVANFGKDVWPAAVASAVSNNAASSGPSIPDFPPIIDPGELPDGGSVKTWNYCRINGKVMTKNDYVADQNAVTGSTSTKSTVTVDVDVEKSTNGLMTLKYDAAVLSVDAIDSAAGVARYSVRDDEAGTITFAYAKAEEVTGTVATITFAYNPKTAPASTTVTITLLEDGLKAPNTVQRIPMTFRAAASAPVQPSVPGGTAAPGTTTEDGEGNVTTTVTGSDGTVTETTKRADGSVVETVTSPDGGKAITVVDIHGDQIIAVKLPAATPDADGFVDVPEGHWAESAINNVAALGLVRGVDEEKRLYDMTSPVTRGTMATILFRLSHGPAAMKNSFRDVANGAWYADAVAWAAHAGVVTGYSETAFGPNDTITREQMAVMVYRYAQSMGMGFQGMWMFSLDFEDADSVSDWAYEAVCWMSMNEIMTGKPGNKMEPTGLVSRAELATVLDRFIDLLK